MNKPIKRWDIASNISGTDMYKFKDGEYVKYSDHQELLQGLLKDILEKEGVPYISRKGIVSTVDIIAEFEKLGVTSEQKADLILAQSRIQTLEHALNQYANPSNWESRQLSSKCAKVWTKRNQNGWELAKTTLEGK